MASNTVAQQTVELDTVKTSLLFPSGLYKRAKMAAVQHDTTFRQIVMDGLELRLRELEAGAACLACAHGDHESALYADADCACPCHGGQGAAMAATASHSLK